MMSTDDSDDADDSCTSSSSSIDSDDADETETEDGPISPVPPAYRQMLRDLSEVNQHLRGAAMGLLERGAKLERLEHRSERLSDASRELVRSRYGPPGRWNDLRHWWGETAQPQLRRLSLSASRCWYDQCTVYWRGLPLAPLSGDDDDDYDDDYDGDYDCEWDDYDDDGGALADSRQQQQQQRRRHRPSSSVPQPFPVHVVDDD